MEHLPYYFSDRLGSEFRKELPKILREKIGSRPFERVSPTYGVGANTFRAFTNLKAKPSTVYRSWASNVCRNLDIQLLEHQLKTEEGFRVWHASLAKSLQDAWQHEQDGDLIFAHQHKLIDLFVKWLSSHDFNSPVLLENLVAHANCALDSQTLRKLNDCLSEALPLSKKPSMGDVHSSYTYSFCQSLITRFATHHGGSRLLFDYYAWRFGGSGVLTSHQR